MAWGVLNNRREGVWQQTAKGPCEGCEAALARAEARAEAAERDAVQERMAREALAGRLAAVRDFAWHFIDNERTRRELVRILDGEGKK